MKTALLQAGIAAAVVLAAVAPACSLFGGKLKDVEVSAQGVRIATDAPEVSSSTVTHHSDGSTRVDVYRRYMHECASGAPSASMAR